MYIVYNMETGDIISRGHREKQAGTGQRIIEIDNNQWPFDPKEPGKYDHKSTVKVNITTKQLEIVNDGGLPLLVLRCRLHDMVKRNKTNTAENLEKIGRIETLSDFNKVKKELKKTARIS